MLTAFEREGEWARRNVHGVDSLGRACLVHVGTGHEASGATARGEDSDRGPWLLSRILKVLAVTLKSEFSEALSRTEWSRPVLTSAVHVLKNRRHGGEHAREQETSRSSGLFSSLVPVT